MQTGEPSETGGQASPEAVETAGGGQTETVVAQPTPIFQGDASVLWATAGSMLAVFFIVIMLIIRSNARASRRRAAVLPADFFQPAGEGAEISFDDEEANRASSSARGKKEKKKRAKEKTAAEKKTASRNQPPQEAPEEAEVMIAAPAQAAEEPLLSEEPSLRAASAPPTAHRESGLAGFFGKGKKKAAAQAHEPEAAHAAAFDDEEHHRALAGLQMEETTTSEKHPNAWAKIGAADALSQRAANGPRYGEDEAAAARRQVEDEFRRIEDERRASLDREAEFERRKHMAALDQQRRTLEEQERSLFEQAESVDRQFDGLRRDLADELDARFEAMTARVDERLSRLNAAPASVSTGASEDQISAIAELISRRLGEERDAFDGAIAALSDRVDTLSERLHAAGDLRQEIAALKRSVSSLSASGLAGRGAAPSAPTVQLADVLRAVLPAKSYETRAVLSNGRRADCLIRLPNLLGPIAVDGQFPAEAFLRLHAPGGAESLRAENEFRRAALRHIADVAEHLILPGETADSALLFIPSESMYSELHSRFPDIIQDSYRARVWIVSPTTMMATLHAMRAVLRNIAVRSEPAKEDDSELLSELTALRGRVASLEGRFDENEDEAAPGEFARDAMEEYAASPKEEDILPSSDFEESDVLAPQEDDAPEAVSDAAPLSRKAERRDSSEGDLWEEEQASRKSGAPFPLR